MIKTSAISNLKMPKLKHASTAHVASQAKRRKKNQRVRRDLTRRQEQTRRERDAQAHRNARRDPARRQLEQEHDTAARRQVHIEDQERTRMGHCCPSTSSYGGPGETTR